MQHKKDPLSDEFRDQIEAVTAKRARVVIDHILKHGYITTEEIKEEYGYNHPPRAARDVREHGIPLETFKVTGSDGRQIGAYRFDVGSDVEENKLGGRRTWPKNLKQDLLEADGPRCSICLVEYQNHYLQIDHRIPYQVSGDAEATNIADFMLVCASCNRAKSWTCEHCQNWHQERLKSVCLSCYWSSPDQYEHVAMRQIRRLEITWTEEEVLEYEQLASLLEYNREKMIDFIKFALRDSTES